jgi:cell division protease FtsH
VYKRQAEELIFGADKITTGASSDIKMATDLAKRMISEWGMSENLGFQAYSKQEDSYLGMNSATQAGISQSTMEKVDKEIKNLIDYCFNEAKKLLIQKTKELHILAQSLLERETLTGDEIKVLLSGGVLADIINTNVEKSESISNVPTT